MSDATYQLTDEQARRAELSESDRHRLLASERRRLALSALAGRTSPVEVEELARDVAARESGVDAPDDAAVERVAVSLHHTHLPLLSDLGAVGYDPASGQVEP